MVMLFHRFAIFEARGQKALSAADIPWPPDESCMLAALAALDSQDREDSSTGTFAHSKANGAHQTRQRGRANLKGQDSGMGSGEQQGSTETVLLTSYRWAALCSTFCPMTPLLLKVHR